MKASYNAWLFWWAVLTALSTLALIGLGGVVTSKEVGLAVPDWPTTYGYNMFLFPPSQWVGGVFYEHTHRLFASFVGLLTTVLAVWIGWKDSRRWMKWLGLLAFVLVCFQGLLGGLRVVWLKDEIGIFHAALAQMFLVLVCCLTLFTSRWWLRLEQGEFPALNQGLGLRTGVLATTILIFLQLVVGAAMRHQHAGLAIPDFPLAYGRLWPPMDAASLDIISRTRLDALDYGPVTALQIGLHMIHRVGAILILAAVSLVAWRALFKLSPPQVLRRLAAVWFWAVLLQGALGAFTIWSNKAADVATLHVLLGATILVLGGLFSVILFKISVDATRPVMHSPPVFSEKSVGSSPPAVPAP